MRTNIRRFKITRLKRLCLLTLAAALCGVANTTEAQTAKTTQTAETTQTAQTPADTSLRVNRVVESQVALDHTLTIVIDDLEKWDQQQDHDTSKFAGGLGQVDALYSLAVADRIPKLRLRELNIRLRLA